MMDVESLVGDLGEGCKRFLSLVGAVRPDLHRYCARMTGSIADGEDVVQETLARAYYTVSELETLPPLRPWRARGLAGAPTRTGQHSNACPTCTESRP